MSNRKATFAKRQRESALKDKARAKEERRRAAKEQVRTEKGPQIAWDEAVYAVTTPDDPPIDAPEGESAEDQADRPAYEADRPAYQADRPAYQADRPSPQTDRPSSRSSASSDKS